MMRKSICLPFVFMMFNSTFSQTTKLDSTLAAMKMQKDSTIRAMIHTDSLKVEKEFGEMMRWEKLKSVVQYPLIKGHEFAGVIPVNNITEIPDPEMDYKLLFELTENNPDSVAKDANFGLVEVARIINLHIASGIPVKHIKPVIVIHAAALKAFTNEKYYQEKYKLSNPNMKLISDLENIGARFIACGQAISFIGLNREALLPDVKVSLTAQTVLSSYQMKGYVWYNIISKP